MIYPPRPRRSPWSKHTGQSRASSGPGLAPLPAAREVQTPAGARRRRGRRGLLPAIISPCRLRLRQPLITRLLMRPAAVCNHPGPRRAAREAAGESAGGGVDGACLLPGRGRARRQRACASAVRAPGCLPGGALTRSVSSNRAPRAPVSSPPYSAEAQTHRHKTQAGVGSSRSDPEPGHLADSGSSWIGGGACCCYSWDFSEG